MRLSRIWRILQLSVNGSIIFDVNDSIICSGLYFWRLWFNMTEFLVNSSCLWWIYKMVDFPCCQKCLQHVSFSHFKFGKLTRLKRHTFSSPEPTIILTCADLGQRWRARHLSVTINIVGVGLTSLDAGPKSAFDVAYDVFAVGQATPGLLLLLFPFPLLPLSYHWLSWWAIFLPYWHYKL